jgi:flagellin-specific chaperone FliS
MKPMRTELTPLRVARSRALIAANTKFASGELAQMAYSSPERFVAMLTDEAIEQLAFSQMADRVFSNKLHAKNRALLAAIRAEATP